jgi:hypothetical protein
VNPFFLGFLDELEKQGGFGSIVHHPLTQAIGYAALAGEGIHLLEGRKKGRLGKFYKSRLGKGIQKGSLGIGSAFLAAEALASLGDLFSKKKKKKPGKIEGPVIINVQPSKPVTPKIRMGKVPKITAKSLGKLTKSIGFKK